MATARGGRPSVCFLVVGHNLLSSAGPTRNVLSLARALSDFADVTVAFRQVLEPLAGEPFSVLEIDPRRRGYRRPIDDAAVRGVGFLEFAAYLRALDRFCHRHLTSFDVVLEKSWVLTGHITSWCLARGIAAVPVVNLVPLVRHIRNRPLKATKNWVARGLSGRYLRRAPQLIAESEDLKASIMQQWRVASERIEVVGLGVDRALFHPTDQGEARRGRGIAADRTVLMYVGALDRAHDLRAIIAAVARLGETSVELHLVGDGELRPELESAAGGSPRVVFHGRVPHAMVPGLIACADLCLAPYDPAFFPGGRVGFATLKVREYLAAGRAVATSRTGVLPGLIQPGVSGFLLENDAATWTRFLLQELPDRSVLRTMGLRAADTLLESWEETARAYWRVCEGLLARTGESSAGGHPASVTRAAGGRPAGARGR
ncbi:MAG TPA: glycosyltransferase family 4 protein [Gemmatimonadales bacterium]|nr:glycosyltransferase family 4 protein [Gemmatimonadales bacterium]